MNATKHMDHAEYQARVKTMSEAMLRYVIADARQALEAYPENPNANYYRDEICYCAQELERRKSRGFADQKVWEDSVLDLVNGMVLHCTPGSTTLAEARAKVYEALFHPVVLDMIRLATMAKVSK